MDNDSKQTKHDGCPVCGSASRLWRRKTVSQTTYPIDLCGACGFAFVNPRPSMAFLREFYATSGHSDGKKAPGRNDARSPTAESILAREAKAPNSSIDARRMIRTIDRLRPASPARRLLDVGCGYGFFSKEALDKGFDVAALELAENERQIAGEITGLAPEAVSFEDFQAERASFSAALMSQILEHAHDVNVWVAKARDLLEADGVLAIALPNFGSLQRRLLQEKEPYICPPAHLNFFSARSLSALLTRHGFRVEKTQWISRVPAETFERRLPKAGRFALGPIRLVAKAPLKLLDLVRLGMMVNVYARKIG